MNIQRLSRSHHRRIFGGYDGKILSHSPTALWPMWETGGSVANCLVNPAQSGNYSGVTLGQAGIGDGNVCPLWDGVNDYANFGVAAFINAFNTPASTIFAWAKVSGAGVWTDGSIHAIVVPINDGSNYALIRKNTTNNQMLFTHKAGGTAKSQTVAGVSTTDWFTVALTWDEAADQAIAYINGARQGAVLTGLGTWNPVTDPLAHLYVGSYNSTPIHQWSGWLAYVAYWNFAKSAADILDLSTL